MIENGRGLKTQSQYRGLRNDRYVYIRHDRTGERELYDLRRDRYQLNNLAKDKRFRAGPHPDGPARAHARALPRRRAPAGPAGPKIRVGGTCDEHEPFGRAAARSTASGGS